VKRSSARHAELPCPVHILVAALLAVVVLLTASPAQALTTYTFSGPTFDTIDNHSTCVVGTCAEYTTAHRVTGTIITASVLNPNLGLQDISGLVSSWTFSDGVNTIASTQPAARVGQIHASTDGAGNITSVSLNVYLWQALPPTLDGTANERFNSITILDFVPLNVATTNARCTEVSGLDCSLFANNTDSSTGQKSAMGTWTTGSTQSIPTLSEWGQLIAFALVAGIGALALHRRAAPDGQRYSM